MDIRPDSNIVPKPGDFLARVDGGELIVAPQLAQFARTNRLSSAEALAGYADAFPTTLADVLGWHVSAVKMAIGRLMLQMEMSGALRASDLQPPVQRVYGFRGARSQVE